MSWLNACQCQMFHVGVNNFESHAFGIHKRRSGLEKDSHAQISSDTLPLYLVLEHNPIIADDLIGALESAGPCKIVHVARPDDLAPALDGVEGLWAAAFLEMRLADLSALGLDRRLGALGARIVLTIGEDDEEAVKARGYSLVVRPFSDEMIMGTLAQAGLLHRHG